MPPAFHKILLAARGHNLGIRLVAPVVVVMWGLCGGYVPGFGADRAAGSTVAGPHTPARHFHVLKAGAVAFLRFREPFQRGPNHAVTGTTTGRDWARRSVHSPSASTTVSAGTR